MCDIRARVAVRVHARSSRIGSRWDGKVLELWVREPPVDGVANTAVMRAVASWLRIHPSGVRVVAGHSHRSKILEITGVSTLPPPEGPD